MLTFSPDDGRILYVTVEQPAVRRLLVYDLDQAETSTVLDPIESWFGEAVPTGLVWGHNGIDCNRATPPRESAAGHRFGGLQPKHDRPRGVAPSSPDGGTRVTYCSYGQTNRRWVPSVPPASCLSLPSPARRWVSARRRASFRPPARRRTAPGSRGWSRRREAWSTDRMPAPATAHHGGADRWPRRRPARDRGAMAALGQHRVETLVIGSYRSDL